MLSFITIYMKIIYIYNIHFFVKKHIYTKYQNWSLFIAFYVGGKIIKNVAHFSTYQMSIGILLYYNKSEVKNNKVILKIPKVLHDTFM